MREEIDTWRIRPVVAAVFGSAARSDGDTSSDIDVLLVHPPFPGEPKPAGWKTLGAHLADGIGEWVLASPESRAAEKWDVQVDRLRDLLERWTGNPAQIVDLTFREWRRPSEQTRPLLAEVERDGIELHRAKLAGGWPSRLEAETGNG